MKVIYFGEKLLLKVIRENYERVVVVKNIKDFFEEQGDLRLIDGQLFDDIRRQAFLGKIFDLLKKYPKIKIHIIQNLLTSEGPISINALRDKGAIVHQYFNDSPVPFEEQFKEIV